MEEFPKLLLLIALYGLEAKSEGLFADPPNDGGFDGDGSRQEWKLKDERVRLSEGDNGFAPDFAAARREVQDRPVTFFRLLPDASRQGQETKGQQRSWRGYQPSMLAKLDESSSRVVGCVHGRSILVILSGPARQIRFEDGARGGRRFEMTAPLW